MTGFFLSAVRQMEVVWSISRYISYVYKKLKKIFIAVYMNMCTWWFTEYEEKLGNVNLISI